MCSHPVTARDRQELPGARADPRLQHGADALLLPRGAADDRERRQQGREQLRDLLRARVRLGVRPRASSVTS